MYSLGIRPPTTVSSNWKMSGQSSAQALELADDVGILAGTAGLLLVLEVELGGLGGRLAVADFRRTDFDLDAILAANPLDVDIQVQLAHAGDDRLGRFLVGHHAERGVFAAEAVAAPCPSCRRPRALSGLMAILMTGSATNMLSSVQYLRSEAEGIAAGAVDAQHRHDIARPGRVDFLALVGVHLDDAAEALLLVGALVEVHVALLDRALVDPHERQLAERVFDHLEGHAHERLGRIGLQCEGLRRVVILLGLHRTIQAARGDSGRWRPAAAARPCCDRRCPYRPASGLASARLRG